MIRILLALLILSLPVQAEYNVYRSSINSYENPLSTRTNSYNNTTSVSVQDLTNTGSLGTHGTLTGKSGYLYNYDTGEVEYAQKVGNQIHILDY